jgi:hypothetical protein
MMTGFVSAIRAARATVAATACRRLGTTRHTRGGGDTGAHGRHTSRACGDNAGGAARARLALADHTRPLHQTRPHVVGDERGGVLAVEGATVAALVDELGVDGERDVERVGQGAHFPRDAARLANKRADHRVAVAGRQADLRVAVQCVYHLL